MYHSELRHLIDAPNESLLRLMLSAAPFGVSIGIDGKIVYANEECARMWGYSSGLDMADVPFFHLIAPEWHPLVQLVWTAGRNRRIPWSYELEGVRCDGARFPYRITSFSLDLDSGKVAFAYFEPIESCSPFEVQSAIINRMAEALEHEDDAA